MFCKNVECRYISRLELLAYVLEGADLLLHVSSNLKF